MFVDYMYDEIYKINPEMNKYDRLYTAKKY